MKLLDIKGLRNKEFERNKSVLVQLHNSGPQRKRDSLEQILFTRARKRDHL